MVTYDTERTEILKDNWNKVVELSKINKRTGMEQEEYSYRLFLQNAYANSSNDGERETIVLTMTEINGVRK